jgi:restriction system protein
MPIPPFESHLLPALRLISNGELWDSTSLAASLADHFHLSIADRQEMLPSGVRSRYHDRAYWSLTYLLRAGLLERPERGRYRITAAGRMELASNPSSISKAYLQAKYPSFAAGISAGSPHGAEVKCAAAAANSIESAATPMERLEEVIAELEESLVLELQEKFPSINPANFERLVLRVLVAMGYAHDPASVLHTGQTGDEGIDGVVAQDHLGMDRVYVQAKNQADPVSGPEMSKFIGALDQKRGTKGVFFTRSTFTQQARHFASNSTKQIILVDGKRLAELMARFGVGVATTRQFRVARIDQDYFDDIS